MIPWKRTLAWLLCALVGSVAAAAEESAAPPAAAAVESAENEVPPSADPGSIAQTAAEDPSAEAPVEPVLPPTADTEESEAVSPDASLSPEAASPEIADAVADDASGSMAPAAESSAPSPAETTKATSPLGVIAYDSQGRQGRIHIVVPGDTLWDIADAYLGTPWVWPSIWRDNGEIENPHRIHPGERIWITPTEMRRISPEEAEVLLSNVPEAGALPAAPEPAALEQPVEDNGEIGPFQTALAAPSEGRSYRVSARETAGLVSPEKLKSAASVVGSVPGRVFLSQEDELYIGLGEGEVQPGDEFTLFRTNDKVFDPDTGLLLGYHVDILGWVRVEKTFPETSLASIRMSTGEIERGDRVMPRQPLPPEIEIQSAPTGVDGKISYFPGRRVLMGFQDFVYLNRGSLDGLEIGSPLEVYRPGYHALETARQEEVEVPDRVIAKLLVVRAETDSAVAVVTATEDELELGDRFRGATE